MDIGVLGIFQNWHKDLSDEQMFLEELRMLERCEELGFDSVWCVEHHFDDYSMCPDNVVALGYLAGRTSRIRLATGAVILPWNDPLRVAEKVTMLDHLTGGRMMFGMGRGLSKIEYGGFRIEMGEARERFDEAAQMIVRALETGIMEGDGPFYKQQRVEIRPRPSRPIRDRMFCVALSPDSIETAARLGATMTTFAQYDMAQQAPDIARYRRLFREFHGREAPPPVITDFVYCHPDLETASRVADAYIPQYFLSLVKHYDFAGVHFGETKGYQAYAEGARLIREAGLDNAAAAYKDAQSWGTPERIIAHYTYWREQIGDFALNVVLSYAGMPYDLVEQSQRLFAAEVMPVLRQMDATPTRQVA